MATFRPQVGGRGGRIGGGGLGGIGQPVGGGSLRDIPTDYQAALQGKSSNERAAIERKRQQYARQLRARGFNSAVANSASRVMAVREEQEISRPMSVLGGIARGLGAIEQAGAGYLRGVTGAAKRGENPFLAAARGVAEIPGAVQKEYGFAQYLKEQVDPKDTTSVGRFIHEHAGPIGFGMALVFDPTMYLSFGATSASKQVAYKAIASQYSESAQTARQVLETGGNYGGRKWDDLEDLTLQIHQDAGRPVTLHQSLAQQREMGLAGKRAARRGDVPGAGPITTARKTATGYLLPTNVRGGAGVRFAGMEIPGTPRLGEALGRKVRAGRAARIGADEGGGVQRMFVTNFRQKLIADDLKRALALSKMTDFQTSMRVARTQAEKLAAQAARAGTTLGEVTEEAGEVIARNPDEPMDDMLRMKVVDRMRTDAVRPDKFPVNEDQVVGVQSLADQVSSKTIGSMNELFEAAGKLDEALGAAPEGSILEGVRGMADNALKSVEARAAKTAAKRAPVPKGKPQMIPLGDRLAAEAPIKMYRGDPEQVQRYTIDKTSAAGAVGRGFYLTESEDVAKTFAESRWGFEGMLGDPVGEGVVRETAIPKSLLDKTYDTSAPMTPEVRQMVVDTLGEMKSGANDINDQELTHLQKVVSDPEAYPTLYDVRELVGEGIGFREATENWGESILEDELHLIFEGMKDKLAQQGYKGYKYPTKLEGAKAYEELPDELVPDHEYSFWDEDEFNALIRGEHPEQKIPASRMMSEIDQRVADEMAAAKEMGLSSRATREMWERIKQENPDPAVALANFVWRNQSMVLSRRFLDDMLQEPMFAKPIDKDVLATELPKGQKPFAHPKTGQRYAVLGEIAEALEDFANPVVIDKGTSEALRLMNLPQNFWKQYATLPNPSFHVMNFLGAVWNNMLGSVYNPADYVRAASTVYKAKVEREAERGGRVLGRRVTSTPQTREASQLVEEAEVRGALGSVSIFAELGQGDRMLADIEVPPTVKDRLKSLGVRRPTESRKRYATRQTRRLAAVGLAATANPLALAAMAPELVQVGRRASSAMEDVVRMAPFMKMSKDPTLKQYLHAYGPITVPGNKHPGFSKGEQAAMYDISAALTKQFQFDYTDLTDFERRFAKTIFPFYTFYRKNFVLQAQMLAEKPRNTVAALTAINYLNENTDLPDGMQELLPDYFENIQAVAVPVPGAFREKMGLPQDVPLFLNPKLPFLTLNLMPPVWDIFRDTGQPTKQKVLAAFAPMFGSIGPWAPFPVPGMKMILEASVGEQLGLNKTIDYQRAQSNDWRNSWVPAPALAKFLPEPVRDFMGIFPWGDIEETKTGEMMMTATGLYFLEQMSTPFVNNLGQTIPVGGPGYEGQKARADLVSWMTGVRLMPVDTLRMHRSWAYRLKSMLESQKADLEDRGEHMEPEDRKALRMVRQQVKILERSWDRQQAELYGPETQRR